MKLMYGVGINDANYSVTRHEKKKIAWICPFYSTWRHMLERCYYEKYKSSKPSYDGCHVCQEWLTFSNFKKWMECQHWEGRYLDKDILVEGNKLYSAETCVFVDRRTNTFLIDRGAARGEWPIGVSKKKSSGKFQANCRNTFSGKGEYLGYFDSPVDAHCAWRKRKHELACKLAEIQDDPRVSAALIRRFKGQ